MKKLMTIFLVLGLLLSAQIAHALQQGSRVAELIKKAGQVPRTGTVVEVHGHDVEVRWDDGHTSIISRNAVHEIPRDDSNGRPGD